LEERYNALMSIQSPPVVSSLPTFLYGTAWKEDHTQRLTELALQTGFRGIDTANQRRHYHEAAVGDAIKSAIEQGIITRADLFLQTKFTFQRGQDHRLPYDPNAPISTQVRQSFASSLEHLGVQTLDSYLLHGPSQRVGLTADDWAAWRAIEELHDSRSVRMIGISNVSLDQLQALCEKARTPPRFVQNRCYAAQGWDRQVRAFCRDHGIVYQGFSLLTANQAALASRQIQSLAARHGRTVPQIIFRFAMDVGMLPLTGTTNAAHMREDLAVDDFQLSPDEIELIDHIADK
jgi:diketogulonate reductase-like aldo/keto reductase